MIAFRHPYSQLLFVELVSTNLSCSSNIPFHPGTQPFTFGIIHPYQHCLLQTSKSFSSSHKRLLIALSVRVSSNRTWGKKTQNHSPSTCEKKTPRLASNLTFNNSSICAGFSHLASASPDRTGWVSPRCHVYYYMPFFTTQSGIQTAGRSR